MKRRLRRPFLNVAKIVLIGVLVTLIVIVGVFVWNLINKPTEPNIVVEESTYEYSLYDYKFYKPDNIDFGFIIADVYVSSNVPLSIGLDNLVTSEGISLSQTDGYLSKLTEAKYKPGTQTLSFSLHSSEKALRFNLFIPFNQLDADTITVKSTLLPNSEMVFNLKDSSKQGSESLIKVENNISTLDKDLTVTTNYVDLFDSSNFYSLDAKGQPVTIEFASQDRIYGISLNVSNNSSNTYKVNTARLIIDNIGEYGLLNPDILLTGTINLTKQSLVKNVTGYLFFALPGDQVKLLTTDPEKVHLALDFVSGETLLVEGILKK